MATVRVDICGGAREGKSALITSLGSGVIGDGKQLAVVEAANDEQYTRNLAARAPIADVNVIVVDARQGVTAATRRHGFFAALIGVRQVVLAVNKMDLVSDPEGAFARIDDDFKKLAAQLGLAASGVSCVPIAAESGANVRTRSAAMPWYQGPTLVELLDRVEPEQTRLREQPLRLPIRTVNRAGDPGGLEGTVVAGRVRTGDAVRVQPSGELSRVTRISGSEGDLAEAVAGQAVTIALEGTVDVSPGDLIVAVNAPAEIANQFEATVVWLAEAPLLPGRSYILRVGTATATAAINPLKYKINLSTLDRIAATTLVQKEIGVCNLQVDRALPFDPYKANRTTGGFVLVDKVSGAAVGAGMLHFALRRAQNVHWQALDVNKGARAKLKGQKPCVLWYTGLSGAGKSTIANMVDKRLHASNRHTYLLDGDNVRHGLNRDLGFTDADRVENIRRIAEVAKLMVDAGLIVSTAFISPFRAERQMARALVADGEFIEIFIDTPLGIAEERDPKGLYKKARRGDLKNFTGIDSPYEKPEAPELTIDTTMHSPEQAAEAVVAYLQQRGIVTIGGDT
ncbi:MAG TPA: adenylyl-sulfate kinase [Polyangia bacterium]|jgi:bifunctional enzyme CysN/CysC